MVKTATTAIVAAFGALLSMTGCASDEGSGGGERLGQVQQALTCGTTICPADDCFVYVCGGKLNSQCVVQRPKVDSATCITAGQQKGVCGTADGVTVCCPGCLAPGQNGGSVCQKGTDISACGRLGFCENCTADLCGDPVCDQQTFTCQNKKYPDGDKCNDGSGSCFKGDCCTGCIDKVSGACVQNDVKHCGISAAGVGLVSCDNCDDGLICSTDACEKGTCVHGAAQDGISCVDGDKCNGDEQCKGGKCVGPGNFTCDDANACTAESCDAVSGCAHQKLTGTPCLDANKCNGAEACNNGVCAAGTPLDCNDNNPCTMDGCSALNGCSNVKQTGTSCADANKCNGAEMCNNGVCTAGTAPNCDDGNPCTADSCDPSQGCLHTTVSPGTNCDDGNKCNGISTCVGSVCTPGTALSCDDGNVCTDDSCVPATGCKFVNNTADCSDNDVCTTNDKCDGAGACKGGAPPNCDDNEACTKDSCDSAKGCVHAAVMDGNTCDDGNDCSTGDKCVAGKCKASGGKLCDDSDPCTQNTCDPQNGSVCAYPAETNGTPCTFDKCHQNSSCQAGKCNEGEPIDCDDANPCTIDSCDAATGCKHVADNTAKCSDGDLCTNADHCKSGVCIGTDVSCTAFDECHEVGSCNANTGVCDDPRSEDGKECTGGHCELGKCILDPVGAGGAGGDGAGGDGTTGPNPEGGAPGTPGAGGEGNQLPEGGAPATGTGGNAGKAGGANAGSSATEGGDAAEVPDRVFVRDPGGCSCRMPGSERSSRDLGLAGLAIVGLGFVARARRRRSEGRREAA